MTERLEGTWFVEEGIGEHRAIRIADGEIVSARLHWPGALAAGAVGDAVLVARIPDSPSGIVRFPSGEEAFAQGIPRTISEGASVRIEVTREAIAERGRLKRAQARHTDEAARATPTLAQTLNEEGFDATIVRCFPEQVGWSELLAEAWDRGVAFPGGELLFADTPAMTLIDVDTSRPESVLHYGVPAIAAAIRRFDIGGNIGIDFPTIVDRDLRRAIDRRLGDTLSDWPHERTAMNGFGFVQIVARLTRPSLLQRIGRDRVGAVARSLLRQAERISEPGAILLTAHPAVLAAMDEDWLAELARRTGREVRKAVGPALALRGGFAQAVQL